VKFLFPNPHDVYMHDTTQRSLFGSKSRAFSHGCIRVQNPMKFAEILIAQDRNISESAAAAVARSGGTVALQKHVPVYNTYMTAVVDETGNISAFGDLYGHDSRVSAALGGKVRDFNSGLSAEDIETASIADGADPVANTSGDGEPRPANKKKGEKTAATKKHRVPENFSEAMSGLVAN
jgi:L,D-transpeptidase YcbB